MSKLREIIAVPSELVLGVSINERVPAGDQKRQRAEVVEILRRLGSQPGMILADEVGMGKTFVALAVAYTFAINSPRGPVIVMVPANLVNKWEDDLKTFCELYLQDRRPVNSNSQNRQDFLSPNTVRYGVARHSVDLMKLLDDSPRERCHIIFLAQGAMAKRQTDKWIRLALIAEALRLHGRGMATQLIKVKEQIHRFLGELLWAIGEERAHGWGEELWRTLIKTDPKVWRDTYNQSVRDPKRRLVDHPVPKVVVRCLQKGKVDLRPLAESLKGMPIRASGGENRISDRLTRVRKALKYAEERLWKELLSQARWRSPLLVMDEAHHLKNPETAHARQFQAASYDEEMRTGDGAMADVFDRMLFLTATPFQLGHHELVRVMERFGDVRWNDEELGNKEDFHAKLGAVGDALTESQRTAIALQKVWTRLRLEDCDADVDAWWARLQLVGREALTCHQKAVVEAFHEAKRCRDEAARVLKPWILRHNKGTVWDKSDIQRRIRREGAQVNGGQELGGLPIPEDQLLPFFLAARSAVNPRQDLLGEALCSSYEAFRLTREKRSDLKDTELEEISGGVELAHANWYLREFDQALEKCSGSMHPKMSTTVRRVVDLWEAGEKVLVFGFYRHTCRALRVHIGAEIDRRLAAAGIQRLQQHNEEIDAPTFRKTVERIQDRFFDKLDAPGRRALDAELNKIVSAREAELKESKVSTKEFDDLIEIMRRFLRVPTTLARSFPLAELETLDPVDAVNRLLDHTDSSQVSWRKKFEGFIFFLLKGCTADERRSYLDAARITKTGRIRVERDDEEDEDSHTQATTLANVQSATGKTKRDKRAQLMKAFNTPFFPDILVCSQVMGEGVDLQRFCRHVIHHDLDWNPSTIEQRTGVLTDWGARPKAGIRS